MNVVCCRPGCGHLTRTPIRGLQPHCSPECAQAARTAAVPIVEVAAAQESTPYQLAMADQFATSVAQAAEYARILAIADQLYLADDTDSAFVTEQMREAVAPYVGFDEPKPRGWLARAIARLRCVLPLPRSAMIEQPSDPVKGSLREASGRPLTEPDHSSSSFGPGQGEERLGTAQSTVV